MKPWMQFIPLYMCVFIIVFLIWESHKYQRKANECRLKMLEAMQDAQTQAELHHQTQTKYNEEKAWFLLTKDVPQKMSGCMDDEEIRAGVTAARNIMWKNTELRNLTRLELVAVIAYISKERDDMRGFNTQLGIGQALGQRGGVAQSPPNYGSPIKKTGMGGLLGAVGGQAFTGNELAQHMQEYQQEIDRFFSGK